MRQGNRFLKDESGAVATDWVVVTAGVVGLGLVTVAGVAAGVQGPSTGIRDTLGVIDVRGGIESIVGAFDFADGDMAGWVGGRIIDMGGQLGELLVLGPGQSTGYRMEIPSGTELATMTFDLVAGDSLDNSVRWGIDTATMLINGVPIAIATVDTRDGITFQIPQQDGTTVEAVVTVNEEHLGGRNNWTDSVANITVQVSRPTEDLHFELVSNANQGINDEFWGLDNFEAGVTSGTGF